MKLRYYAYIIGSVLKLAGLMISLANSEHSEPNESEATSDWIFIVDVNAPKKFSLDFIPIWPDYVELEKDLVLRYDFPEPNNPMIIHVPSDEWLIKKGTKIYFKED